MVLNCRKKNTSNQKCASMVNINWKRLKQITDCSVRAINRQVLFEKKNEKIGNDTKSHVFHSRLMY